MKFPYARVASILFFFIEFLKRSLFFTCRLSFSVKFPQNRDHHIDNDDAVGGHLNQTSSSSVGTVELYFFWYSSGSVLLLGFEHMWNDRIPLVPSQGCAHEPRLEHEPELDLGAPPRWPDHVPPQPSRSSSTRSSQPPPPQIRQRSEAGLGNARLIRPRYDQLWHGNLQPDARAMVILLQVGSVEPGGREVTFQGYFEGLNSDQTMYCPVPVRGGGGHTRFLRGRVEPLVQYERDAFIGYTVRRIARFLGM